MDTRNILTERFFQFLVEPRKRQLRISKFFSLQGADRSIVLMSLLLSCSFIVGLGLILYSYQKIKEDVLIAQNAAIETKLERGNFIKEISNLRNLLTFRPQFWYRSIYGVELLDQRLLNLLDKKLLTNTKSYCVPYMMNLICDQLSSQLQREDWEELFDSFRIYLMLIGKETFSKKAVCEWFLNRSELLLEALPLQGVEISGLLESITSQMFENLETSYVIYDKILVAIQAQAFSQSVYNNIAEKLSVKPELNISKFASKRLLCLFNPVIANAKVSHLYTKEGYADFESHKKAIINSFLKIKHLKDVLDAAQVKNAIEETTENYKEAYESELRNMWSKIQFKNSKDIEGCLETVKALSEELPSLLHFVRRVEKSMRIQGAKHYFNKDELLEQGKENLEMLSGSISEKVGAYIPTNSKEALKGTAASIQANLLDLVQCGSAVVNSKNSNHACYKLIIETPKEEFVIFRGLVLAGTLPFPLGGMYKGLIENFNLALNKGSANYVNGVWHRDVYSYYVTKVHNKYPLNPINYQNQLSLEDFAEFFAIGGKLDQFKKTYLENGRLLLSSQAKKILKHFEQIQSHWFGENMQLKVAFNITNVTISSAIKHVDLYMLGQHVRINSSNLGPNEFTLTNKGIEIAKAEFLDSKKISTSIVYAGPWSWYKLLELEDALHHGEPLRRVLKTSSGEIGFLVHFNSRFFSLSNPAICLPKAIVVTN